MGDVFPNKVIEKEFYFGYVYERCSDRQHIKVRLVVVSEDTLEAVARAATVQCRCGYNSVGGGGCTVGKVDGGGRGDGSGDGSGDGAGDGDGGSENLKLDVDVYAHDDIGERARTLLKMRKILGNRNSIGSLIVTVPMLK